MINYNVAKQAVNRGAGMKVTFSGFKPEDVEKEVNLFFNHGALTSIPEDYNPARDLSVTCNSMPKHFKAGVSALAETAIRREAFVAHCVRAGKAEWHKIAKERAEEIHDSFSRGEAWGGNEVEGAGVEVALN